MTKKLLSCLLLFFFALALGACQTETSTTHLTTTTFYPDNEEQIALDQTIYVQADVSGEITSMVAVNRLKNVSPGLYVEYGDFLSALNLTGSESIELESDRLLVPVLRSTEDFYYRATLDAGYEPPFTLNFSYKKEGTAIDPHSEKGESGSYTIETSIAPNLEAPMSFQTGWMASIQLSLSAQGTIITDAGGSMVNLSGGVYTFTMMAFPGMTADITLAFDTTHFAIHAIQATFSPFDPMLLNDLVSFADDLQLFQSGLESLVLGLQTISSGTNDVLTQISLMDAGLSEAASGLDSLNDGMIALVAGLDMINNQFATYVEAMQLLQASGVSLQNGYLGLMSSVNDVVSTFSALHSEDVDLLTKLATLNQTASAIQSALTAFLAGLDDLVNGALAISAGLAPLLSNLHVLADHLDDLSQGVTSLSEGLSLLTAGFAPISEGLATILANLRTMQLGLGEQLDNLTFLFQDPVQIVSFTAMRNPSPDHLQFIFSIPDFQP
ncbi:MAG: hypothetical protein PHS68_03225 [Candidatus Izemoplasmatales bacterium]|nr:hypothetical protein [Candidatus Izemoplasmatales bacterium]MDY0372990.1 hypothetical protein [Candidatus Izemoplasmatales bacterium]